MGRAQTFDTGTAVRAARDLFWDRGFEATSLSDLERATGLNRSSLYHAFGSKRGLFDAAAQDYLDTVIRPRLAPLTAEDGAGGAGMALEEYFSSLGRALSALPPDARHHGCLLINATADLAAHDAVARAVVDDYRAELTAALRGALARAVPAHPTEALDADARMLASLSISAMVVARINTREAVALLRTASDVVGQLTGTPVAGP